MDSAERDAVEELLSHRGRLLLRYSGTEPLARVMIEGENQAKIEAYAHKIARAIEREIGAVCRYAAVRAGRA